MQKLDERIRCALRRFAERSGSVLALSRILGVSHSTVLFWLNGRIRNISTDLWQQKVFPVLEEDLCFLAGKEMTPFQVRCYYQAENFCSTRNRVVRIPLMKEQDLLSYRMPLEGIVSFAERCAMNMICLEISSASAQNCCSVRLDHLTERSGIGWYTLAVFTEKNRLSDHELVLLRIRGEEFLRICRFHSAEGKLSFEDIVSCRNVVSCDDETREEEELSRILWTFPVTSIRFCCRKQGALFNTLWSL